MRINLTERLGLSIVRAQSHHATGIDRHWLRPNNLVTVRLIGLAVCLYWPRSKASRHASQRNFRFGT